MSSEKIVSNIAGLRERGGYTQVELAALVGVTPNTVQNWEKGKGVEQIERCLKLCTVLNCDLSELIDYVPDPDADTTSKKRKGFSLSELEQLSRSLQDKPEQDKESRSTKSSSRTKATK